MSNYLETLLEKRSILMDEIDELKLDLEELEEEIKFVMDDMSGRLCDE